MKKLKITPRDITFFVLGFFALFLIDLVMDWDNNVQSFNAGVNNAKNNTEQVSE